MKRKIKNDSYNLYNIKTRKGMYKYIVDDLLGGDA